MVTATEQIRICPCCQSNDVILHGKTQKGTRRYRCVTCNKTWTDTPKNVCPDIEDLAEEYLRGGSYRQMQMKYHTSAHHLNERIRTFLTETPCWEEYIDTCVTKFRESRLIHLVGIEFHCCEENHSNKMFLALAVDSISTLILGFEIANMESKEVWLNLLDRLNCRGFLCPIFMSLGSTFVDDAVKIVFPQSTHLTQYYRAEYDRNMQNRIKVPYETDKFLIEALASYQSIIKPHSREYTFMFREKNMREILNWSKDYFIHRLETRITTRSMRRIEGLKSQLIERFKGFRILKEDPYPLVKGWIALSMVSPLDIGFSRLSLYMQVPVETDFRQYAKKELPKSMVLNEDSEFMRRFVIEIAIRGLQISNFILPKNYSCHQTLV